MSILLFEKISLTEFDFSLVRTDTRSLSVPKCGKGAQVPMICGNHVADAVAERCKIPIAQLANDERERLLDIEHALEQRVKGQPEAIHAVADAVRVARSGMKDPRKPIAVFLFAGPTGTGKTELAKGLAKSFKMNPGA